MQKKFHYNGRDTNGTLIKGDFTANNIEEVVTYLKQQNIIPLDINPITQDKFHKVSFKLPSSLLSLLTKRVEPYHLMTFFRQLATLSDAGLSVIRAINRLSSSANSKILSATLTQIANDIAAGFTLAEALKKHPTIFSPLMVNLVDIGENTGHLGESLRYLTTYLEASIANRRRLASAIRYPMFVIVTIVAAIITMNFAVIPKFSQMFSKFGLQLPLATRIIMSSSDFMVNNGKLLLIAVIALIIGSNKLLKLPRIRYHWDKNKLLIPIFGDLQKRIIISQFTWTFSLILRAGVPIIKGINLASHTTENIYFSSQLAKMATAIEHGENLSRAAIASQLFTPITIQMIEVGEESEKVDEALTEVARYYDAEIDFDLKRLNEMIEPILLSIIGAIILILAIGIYFPLWDLIKVAQV